MTYLQYKQIELGEGKSVDLEHDVAQANEERAKAIRAFLRVCARRLPHLLSAAAGKMAPHSRRPQSRPGRALGGAPHPSYAMSELGQERT